MFNTVVFGMNFTWLSDSAQNGKRSGKTGKDKSGLGKRKCDPLLLKFWGRLSYIDQNVFLFDVCQHWLAIYCLKIGCDLELSRSLTAPDTEWNLGTTFNDSSMLSKVEQFWNILLESFISIVPFAVTNIEYLKLMNMLTKYVLDLVETDLTLKFRNS